MIKKTLFVLMVALAIVSCQKKETETLPQLQDVSFKAMEVTPNGGLKADGWDTLCVSNIPDYAHVVIGGVSYDPALFELDGVLYTQSIKFPVATEYCVTEFFLYDDVNGNKTYDDGDVIVFATPEDGSHYGAYVTNGIEYCFPVTAFTKAELPIEVLCFKPAVHEDFGFDWFQVTEIVVRQFCFFGDICITDANAALFAGSIYANGGLNPDEEAVFQVIVKDNGAAVPYSPFNNQAIYGTGKALCVDYPDNLSEVNNFTFELQIWVPSTVPGVFVWQTYATFTSTDAANLFYGQVDLGNNTIVKSFALGTCSPMSNPIFPTWLPALDVPLVTVKAADLATGFNDPGITYKWFFFNDNNNTINNALGSFVAGPGTPPSGTGSSQIIVTGLERVCLATYQFAGTPLASITTFKFSTYNPSAGNGSGVNASGYLNFNVDFSGADNWQKRLVYVPSDNGTVNPDAWQEWDVIAGGTALWRWSGNLEGGLWPGGSLNPANGLVTWNQILAAYPGVRIRISDPFVGIRVGEPYQNGYTENIDAFKFGTGATTVFDFEP